MILCGGAGTRLWPVSRQLFPKQLLSLAGERSLLQQTALRLSGHRFAPAIVVGGEEQRFSLQRQLADIGANIEAILLEPVGRNTAAAAALAAAWLQRKGSDELLLLMPSDHLIGSLDAFSGAIEVGMRHAQNGGIVTFGAQPEAASTQYGYIEAELDQGSADGSFPIARFHEKPGPEKANEYFESGRFFWNSGIFLIKATTLLEEMRNFLPGSLEAVLRSVQEASSDTVIIRPAPESFAEAENISIDHAIMEKTSLGVVVPVQMDWSDVGAWDSVWKMAPKDGANNVTQGDVLALDTRNSLLRNEGNALVATVGLNNVAVVATADAVFVAAMDRVSDVKLIVDELKAEGRECVVSPSKIMQPWGFSETIAQGEKFRVEQIVVDEGQSLSLESDELQHWVVVSGSAQLTIDNTVSTLCEGQTTFISAGTKLRLVNRDKVALKIVATEITREHD